MEKYMKKNRALFLFILLSCGWSNSVNANLGNDLQVLQELQTQFDEEFFEINHGFSKTRHILLHLTKTVGKMASHCEAVEHGRRGDPEQLIDEVIPDLLIHAIQIANQFEVDLETLYHRRLESNRKRFSQK